VLFINIDLSQIEGLVDIQEGVDRIADTAAESLAGMVHARVTELANEKLHTRREMFIEGLKSTRVSEGLYIISLDAKVRWIDDGQPAHSMLDKLLNGPKAKTDNEGNKYAIVPFNHGPRNGPDSTPVTPAAGDLISTVKKAMQKANIPFGKIEMDAAGKPKLGKLHSFSINNKPKKVANSPGQGKGPIGSVRQGPTGIPLLQGINVYQSKRDDGSIKRSVMTFRVATEKHGSQSRWEHPGNAALNMMEDAAKWALETWEKEMSPAILNKILMEIG
jgi:hypothetical protein